MYYFFAMDRIELVVINTVIVGGTFAFAIILNKIRPDHDTNVVLQIGFTLVILFTIIMSMVISFSGDGTDVEVKKDNLPVLISDYRDTQDEVQDISYYHEGNIFGEMNKYFVFGKKESIHYYVYQSAYSGILDKVWEDIVSGKKFNEDAVDCTDVWNANKAIRNKIGTYYVRYDNVILEFSDDEDIYLSEEQIEIIVDKLELR